MRARGAKPRAGVRSWPPTDGSSAPVAPLAADQGGLFALRSSSGERPSVASRPVRVNWRAAACSQTEQRGGLEAIEQRNQTSPRTRSQIRCQSTAKRSARPMSPRSTRSGARRSRSTPARSARPTRSTSTCEAARAAGYADVVAPPMFAVVYCAPVGRAADLRPRDRDQLRDDGARRPGVRVGPAGRGGRRDHDDRERQGHLTRATAAATTCSSRSRPTSAASRSAAEPGPTSCEECELRWPI